MFVDKSIQIERTTLSRPFSTLGLYDALGFEQRHDEVTINKIQEASYIIVLVWLGVVKDSRGSEQDGHPI